LGSFTFEIGRDLFEGRILLSVGPPHKIGDPVIVSVQRTGFHLTLEQISAWLSLYGTIIGDLKYLDHCELPGVLEDNIKVLMRLKKHIPSPLPAFSKKLIVRYKGQPVQCSRCMELGHIRRVCKNETNNWMGYVKTLVDKKSIPVAYFGNWFEYLKDQEEILFD